MFRVLVGSWYRRICDFMGFFECRRWILRKIWGRMVVIPAPGKFKHFFFFARQKNLRVPPTRSRICRWNFLGKTDGSKILDWWKKYFFKKKIVEFFECRRWILRKIWGRVVVIPTPGKFKKTFSQFLRAKTCKGPPYEVLDLPLKFLRENPGFKKKSGRKKITISDFPKSVQNVSRHVLNDDLWLSEAIVASKKSANGLYGTSVRLGDRPLGGPREGYGTSKSRKILIFLCYSKNV